MTELPKTEQELNDLIEAKVNEATEKLTGQILLSGEKYPRDFWKGR